MNKYAAFIALWVVCVAHSQQSSTKLKDLSSSGSPISVSGTITTDDSTVGRLASFSYHIALSAKNISEKPIVLMILKIGVTSGKSVYMPDFEIYDYFFASDLFESGSNKNIQTSVGPLKYRAVRESDLVTATADGKVIFVQFSDGTEWGDKQRAKAALVERERTLQKLEHLSRIHQIQGNDQFVKELLEPSDLQTILYLQNRYKSNVADVTAIFQELKEMLLYANAHDAALKGRTQGRPKDASAKCKTSTDPFHCSTGVHLTNNL